MLFQRHNVQYELKRKDHQRLNVHLQAQHLQSCSLPMAYIQRKYFDQALIRHRMSQCYRLNNLLFEPMYLLQLTDGGEDMNLDLNGGRILIQQCVKLI